ncbi:helix-turn-helix domain-containing protein [Mucilaginibacter sp.]|jgi:DNA-binding winged helix-turn-helix (wHTH) protein|uniref:winged helix-turn-helix domain-containing protein n=1 Tax=Mucilaginibacter sp. TaxID=1882438 RepID=UPI002B86E57D|nr:helix-turn-helix domain-containing protein [Mucilaginibacter sp.]HTI60857.1 helix-turn-helix domain-containing protein [Mucilaginibacter sp.]
MQGRVFIIENRFIVNTERNELQDKMSGEINRLEPRLMKLLCILMEHQGKVVKRELIIKEIWDDYPGANEGLNQAISFLRRVLADDDKKIIQTQPKSGYSFLAVVSEGKVNKPATNRKYIQGALIASVLLLLVLIIIDIYSRKGSPAATQRQADEKHDAEISRLDSIHQGKQMQQFSKDTMGRAAKGDSIR